VLKSQPEAEVSTYEVFTYSKDGRGVLFITTLADDNRKTDQGLIDGFWKTLQVKF
jgi:hypothetical protein